jgi:peptidoglycan hydrolase CwlO-like protein
MSSGLRFSSLVFAFLFLIPAASLHAQDVQSQIDTVEAQKAALDEKIAEYQKQLDALGTQHTTLQSAIQSMTLTQAQLQAKISSTQKSIAATNLELSRLGSQIGTTEGAINEDSAAVASSLRRMQASDDSSIVEAVFSAESLGDAWTAVDAEQQLAVSLEERINDLADAKTTLTTHQTKVAATKAQLSSLNSTLGNQNQQLATQKKQQTTLLAQTKNQEAMYQKLLAAAKAELASYSAFTTNAGGAGLIGNQTICDSWGCYYNQRDSAWGATALNKTQYTIASDGCLLTSVAMVLTHYGYKNVTPATLNANPDNFATYYPAFLQKTVYVSGAVATRIAATIDATLASGNPVIVGMHIGSGTHFVVLTGGAKGVYTMRDPYYAGAKDVPFSSRYTLGSIYQIEKLSVSRQ